MTVDLPRAPHSAPQCPAQEDSGSTQEHSVPLWPDAVPIESLEDAHAEGVVIVCQCTGGEVLMARHDRLAAGVQLWELPRSTVALDQDAVEVATDLLAAEVGLRATRAQLLGRFHPDAGALALTIDVVLLESERSSLPEVESAAPEEMLDWVAEDELDLMMISGSLRDGVSLSALTLWRAWRTGEDALGS